MPSKYECMSRQDILWGKFASIELCGNDLQRAGLGIFLHETTLDLKMKKL